MTFEDLGARFCRYCGKELREETSGSYRVLECPGAYWLLGLRTDWRRHSRVLLGDVGPNYDVKTGLPIK